MLPLWLLRGRAYLKQQIAERVELRIDLLPWHEEFLGYLREQRDAGRRLVLATASNQRYAHGVADHLGIFDDVLGSDDRNNNSGSRKLARIEALLDGDSFEYAGNGLADVPIWREADAAVLVNPSAAARQQATAMGKVSREFAEKRKSFMALLRAMRPHQWLKNLLVLAPLILAHEIDNIDLIVNAVLAFWAFCLCASSVYLLNDMLDLDADRQHPTKRSRPFAAGELAISTGVIAMGGLLLASLVLAMLLPPYFLPVLGIYYLTTLAYSVWLKRAALLDGLVLAGLYTLRLIAGAAAIGVQPSFWLLAFSVFIFLSLAFIKRYSELLLLHTDSDNKLAGRGYKAVDMETLAQLGTASGYLAVLVLALYINGDKVEQMYARPEALWMLCPMMLYWISRMWLLTRRGDMHDDPVVFTIRDVRTWWLALAAGGALLLSVFWPLVRPYLPLPT